MSGEELFGVLVRAIGLCSLLLGVLYSCGIIWPPEDESGEANKYIVITVFWVIIGLALLLGADIFVEVAY